MLLPNQGDLLARARATLAGLITSAGSLAATLLIIDLELRLPAQVRTQASRGLEPVPHRHAQPVHPQLDPGRHRDRHADTSAAQDSNGDLALSDLGMVALHRKIGAPGNEGVNGVER